MQMGPILHGQGEMTSPPTPTYVVLPKPNLVPRRPRSLQPQWLSCLRWPKEVLARTLHENSIHIRVMVEEIMLTSALMYEDVRAVIILQSANTNTTQKLMGLIPQTSTHVAGGGSAVRT